MRQLVSSEETRIVEGLRAGDETVFASLVRRYSASLLRVAQIYVADRAVAEEVVQETWLGVLKGIDRFEARSSLRTWIFRILTNTAKTRAVREGRTIPFSALQNPAGVPEAAVEPERFRDPEDVAWPGHWASAPTGWARLPEERLLGAETRALVAAAIERLPPGQRAVITLRDVQGWRSDEVCTVLGVADTNQRVLLHRARSKVSRVLEDYLERGAAA